MIFIKIRIPTEYNKKVFFYKTDRTLSVNNRHKIIISLKKFIQQNTFKLNIK